MCSASPLTQVVRGSRRARFPQADQASGAEAALSLLQAGCPEVHHYAKPPAWHQLQLSACAEDSSSDSSSSTATAPPHVACVDVEATVRAELRCDGQPLAVALPLRVRRAGGGTGSREPAVPHPVRATRYRAPVRRVSAASCILDRGSVHRVTSRGSQ